MGAYVHMAGPCPGPTWTTWPGPSVTLLDAVFVFHFANDLYLDIPYFWELIHGGVPKYASAISVCVWPSSKFCILGVRGFRLQEFVLHTFLLREFRVSLSDLRKFWPRVTVWSIWTRGGSGNIVDIRLFHYCREFHQLKRHTS